MFLYQITCNGICQTSQSKYKLPATYPLEHNTEAKSHLSPFFGMINAHSSESKFLELMLQHSYPNMLKPQWDVVFLYKERSNVFCHPTHGKSVSVPRTNGLGV